MSHWRSGKLKLKCSLSVLQRALVNIVPQWKSHIQVDPSGNLTITDMSGRPRPGHHLKISKEAPGCRWCDLGFKQAADGSWAVTFDRAGLPREIADADAVITAEVGRMRTRAIARARGFTVADEKREGSKTKIKLIVPVGEEFKIRA